MESTGDALGRQPTKFLSMSSPPDYSFAIGLIVPPLKYHIGVGRAAAVTARVLFFKILVGGCGVIFQSLESTLKRGLVTIVGVISLFYRCFQVP